MTDLPQKPASGRGLRIALAVSVAINLAVLGMIGGAMLRADRMTGHNMPRDLGFGLFAEALTPKNRTDLRRRAMPDAMTFARDHRAMRLQMSAVLDALRADPYDRVTLDLAMQSLGTRLTVRLQYGQVLMLDFLSDMPVAERRLFADRLEASTRKRPAKRDTQPEN